MSGEQNIKLHSRVISKVSCLQNSLGAFNPLLLDTAYRLDLGSLGMGTPLSPVFIVSSVMIALQNILIATISRILVANPAGNCKNTLHY